MLPAFAVGAIEVTARLKCGDDLDLLLKVLEANRPLFEKADRLAKEVLTLTEEVEEVDLTLGSEAGQEGQLAA